MPTLENVIKYIDAAYTLADIPQDEIEFKEHLALSLLCTFFDPDKFYALSYAERVQLIDKHATPSTDNFIGWISKKTDELQEYYHIKQISFLKAYIITMSKSEIDKEHVIKELTYFIEHFEDRIAIDNNDPDVIAVFEPILNIARQHLEKAKINTPDSVNEKEEIKSVRFGGSLSDIVQSKLIEFLSRHQYCESAEMLVTFLNGINPKKQIVINSDRITDMAYLLSELKKNKIIFTKGSSQYMRLFEKYTCPFGSKWANGQVYNESRKLKRNKDQKATSIANFVRSLKK